jgi:methylmalonyl-CoA mutase
MNKNVDHKKEEKLFSEFPPISTEEWEEKIISDLKGADYEKKLIWKPIEGFKVQPYYRAEDLKNLEYLNTLPGEFPSNRGNKKDNNWVVRVDVETGDIEEANTIAINTLKNGVNAIGFNADEATSAKNMETLLKGIDLEKTEINFLSSKSFSQTIDLFIEEIKRQNINKNNVKGSINYDPINQLALTSKLCKNEEETFKDSAKLLNKIIAELPNFKAITINGSLFHNSGGSIIQEIAYSLASGNEYLSRLTSIGLNIDQILPGLLFSFAIGSNYFMVIAKFRAARLLWSKITEQYKPNDHNSQKMNIHAVTSLWNKTIYDPYVNILRNTTEGMSAAIGGIDSMTINPFDITYKKPNEFSIRNAKNTQLILKEESYLNKIVDPAGGSYYIENLTDSIATASWKKLQDIEENGGLIQLLQKGIIKDEIEATAQKRDMDIAKRKVSILGTNQYPNLDETMLEKIKISFDSENKGLNPYRGAEAFEAVRLATEKHTKESGKRPGVFLLSIGNLAIRKARATFSENFFGCAGYEIFDNPGFKTTDEAINAALNSEQEIVVICSSDDEYSEIVPVLTKGIKSKKPQTLIVVAGFPKEKIEDFKKAGVDDFIHVRKNVLETLVDFNKKLGISVY